MSDLHVGVASPLPDMDIDSQTTSSSSLGPSTHSSPHSDQQKFPLHFKASVKSPRTLQELEHSRNYSDECSTLVLGRYRAKFDLNRGATQRRYQTIPMSTVYARLPPNGKTPSIRSFPHSLIKDESDNSPYLLTVRFELPPSPVPSFCLQPVHWAMAPRKLKSDLPLVFTVLRYPPSTTEDYPVPLLDFVREDSPWKYPTDTQLTNLIVRVAKDMDSMPKTTYFCLTLSSIFILNPRISGQDRPLEYRLCPFSLRLNNDEEKPPNMLREEIMMHFMSVFCLKLVTRLENIFVPHFQKRVVRGVSKHPGLMTMYTELFKKSRSREELLEMVEDETRPLFEALIGPLGVQMEHENTILRQKAAAKQNSMDQDLPSSKTTPIVSGDELTLRNVSPTLRTMNNIAGSEKATIDQVTALLQLIACVDSIHWVSSAVEKLWKLILESSKGQLGAIIGILAACVTLLVPSGCTQLTNPASSEKSAPWIILMNIIERVLYEIERSALEMGPDDRSRSLAILTNVQQRLLEAGIGTQLGGSLANYHQKFSFKVLMAIIRVATLSAYHFPVLSVRLIFDRNVQKMGLMAIDACTEPRRDIFPYDMERFVGAMLIMSDFKRWIGVIDPKTGKPNPADRRLEQVWENMNEEAFLNHVLPAWNPSLSDETTAACVAKLTQCINTAVEGLLAYRPGKSGDETAKKVARLQYMCEWANHFAWNAPEQMAAKSYSSPEDSYSAGLLFCRVRPFMLTKAHESIRPQMILDDDEDDCAYDEFWDLQRDWAFATPEERGDLLKASRLGTLSRQMTRNSSTCWTSSVYGAASMYSSTSSSRTMSTASTASTASTSYSMTDSSPMTIDTSTWSFSSSSHSAGYPSQQSIDVHGLSMVSEDYPILTPPPLHGSETKLSHFYKPLTPLESSELRTQLAHLDLQDATLLKDRVKLLDWLSYGQAMRYSIADLNILDPTNPESLPWVPKIKKQCLTAADLKSAVHSPKLDTHISEHFEPRPGNHGAPSNEDLVFFSLPHNRNDLEYHGGMLDPGYVAPPSDNIPAVSQPTQARYNAIRSKSKAEMKTKNPEYTDFMPVTLAAKNHRLCHTKVVSEPGTTGMMEIRVVDAGDKNQLTVGITWDISAESSRKGGLESLLPGRSPTSIGLDLSSGCVYYMGPDKTKIKLPYAPPGGTGTRVSVGIAYRFVYFVVDGTFYPPLPDPTSPDQGYFMLPEHVTVHGLLHFGCGGIKLNIRSLAKDWSLERQGDGNFRFAKSNPLAYGLHLAFLRTRVCPHYHAKRRSTAARCQFPDIVPGSDKYSLLPASLQHMFKLIALSHEECLADNCHLQKNLDEIMTTIKPAY